MGILTWPSMCIVTRASTCVTTRASTCVATRASSNCLLLCASTCSKARASTCVVTRASTCVITRASLLFKNMHPGQRHHGVPQVQHERAVPAGQWLRRVLLGGWVQGRGRTLHIKSIFAGIDTRGLYSYGNLNSKIGKCGKKMTMAGYPPKKIQGLPNIFPGCRTHI